MSEESRLARLGLSHLANKPEELMRALEVMHHEIEMYEEETHQFLKEQIFNTRKEKKGS